MLMHLMSDIHLDFDDDIGLAFVRSIDPGEAKVLILAGDVMENDLWLEDGAPIIAELVGKYSQTLLVPGNHDFYNSDLEEETIKSFIATLEERMPTLKVLYNSSIDIEGIRFAGTPLWFRDHPTNVYFENLLSDFRAIKGYRQSVYRENAKCLAFLEGLERDTVDVVISHMLPLPQSVHKRYQFDNLNRFFLCDVAAEVYLKRPRLWLHGHTHIPTRYRWAETEVICHPRGYPGQWEHKDYKPLLIEILPQSREAE